MPGMPEYHPAGLLEGASAYAELHAREHFTLLRVRTEEASEFYTKHGFRCIPSHADTTHVFELIHAA